MCSDSSPAVVVGPSHHLPAGPGGPHHHLAAGQPGALQSPAQLINTNASGGSSGLSSNNFVGMDSDNGPAPKDAVQKEAGGSGGGGGGGGGYGSLRNDSWELEGGVLRPLRESKQDLSSPSGTGTEELKENKVRK